MDKLIDYIEINPNRTATATVIWLHGLGADGNDFAPVAHELSTHPALNIIRFILPHAPLMPVTLNNGYTMRAWYDILSLGMDQRIDHQGIQRASGHIQQLITHENTRGIPTTRIILAGFSQGAVITLATGLHYPERLGGLLALSGYLPYSKEEQASFSTANAKTPIFLGHGTQDDIVPVSLGKTAFEALKSTHPVSWHDYPMAHSVCPNEIQDIAHWLTERIK